MTLTWPLVRTLRLVGILRQSDDLDSARLDITVTFLSCSRTVSWSLPSASRVGRWAESQPWSHIDSRPVPLEEHSKLRVACGEWSGDEWDGEGSVREDTNVGLATDD